MMAPALLQQTSPVPPIAARGRVSNDWREGLPVITADITDVTIRELHASDATSLCALLTTDDVARLISAPPPTVEGFQRFVAWSRRERAAGKSMCFGIVAPGCSWAAGIIQVRALDRRWDVAEWGFALGKPYWGTGVFCAAAELALDFTFSTLGVHRLEARAAVANGRGIGALRKLGAVQEGVLHKSLRLGTQFVDQSLLTISREDRD